MDEGPDVLARLDRIERLRAAGEPRPVILAEIRELLAAGEAALDESVRPARAALDHARATARVSLPIVRGGAPGESVRRQV